MNRRRPVPRETDEQKQLKPVGEALRNARLRQNKLIQDVEQLSEVSSVTISNLEKGKLENVSLKTLNRIAEVLNCTVTISIQEK